jgi:ankyrin repeat protein
VTKTCIQFDQTALILALVHGHIATVELLIDKGADMEATIQVQVRQLVLRRRRLGKTTLCCQVDRVYRNEFEDFVDKSVASWTALMWACVRGHVASAELLIDKGADMMVKGDMTLGERFEDAFLS